MRVTDRDSITHTELIRIVGTALFAALRRGELTPQQMRKIDRIVAKAEAREADRKH